MENLSPAGRSNMQAFSRQLFGNRHRLEVALAILEIGADRPEAVYKESIAKTLEVTDSEVEKHLKVFRALGMLEIDGTQKPKAAGAGRGRPPSVLKATKDDFWHCLEKLGERFRD